MEIANKQVCIFIMFTTWMISALYIAGFMSLDVYSNSIAYLIVAWIDYYILFNMMQGIEARLDNFFIWCWCKLKGKFYGNV